MTDKSIITIENVSCYEQDGTAYLKLEDVARGWASFRFRTRAASSTLLFVGRESSSILLKLASPTSGERRLHPREHLLPSGNEGEE